MFTNHPSVTNDTMTTDMNCALSLNKDSSFLILPLTLAPPVRFGWNLKWPTIYKHHCWWLDFQGQKGHIKASWMAFWPLFKFFYENSKRPIKKLPVFEKKSSKKFVPRPAAFKTSISFMTHFLWSYSTFFHQI